MKSLPIIALSITCLFIGSVMSMTWHVKDEHNCSYTEQRAFIRMVENAIRKHGYGNTGDVANEVLSECQNKWPASGEKWVVLFDLNGASSVWHHGGYSKKIYIEDSDNGFFVYAVRL